MPFAVPCLESYSNFRTKYRCRSYLIVLISCLPFLVSFYLLISTFTSSNFLLRTSIFAENHTASENLFNVSVTHKRIKVDLKIMPQNSSKRQILLWTTFFGQKRWVSNLDHCKMKNCEVITNRSLINSSDAIIFHWRNIDENYLPIAGSKPPHQIRILFNLEPPGNTQDFHRTSRMLIDSLEIDWTATYRKDSDFFTPYGVVLPSNTSADVEYENNLISLVKQKNKMVAWIVSNCKTHSQRELYVQNLQKYIDVDIYGRCGKDTCPRKHQAGMCWKFIEKSYKFYLAFENSLCKDYVTEKLFIPLKFNVIPVVYGGANYKDISPECSYINALDFRNPRELAAYLVHVANNTELYMRYLAWKKNYLVKRGLFGWICDVCQRLHSLPEGFISCGPGRKDCPDVYDWWYQGSQCKHGEEVVTLQ